MCLNDSNAIFHSHFNSGSGAILTEADFMAIFFVASWVKS